VFLSTISYDAEVRHGGILHKFTVPNLEIPVCQECGEKVFTEKVDDQINVGLRRHLGLLSPEEIHFGIEKLGLTQSETAKGLEIEETTLSLWLAGSRLQSQAMDTSLRSFLNIPKTQASQNGESANSISKTSIGK
jgi:hypothetical protein